MIFFRFSLVLFALFLLTTGASAIEIQLEKEGGVYTLPVRINGVITLNFILDTGASEVSIPADVFLTLLRAGTIKQSDVLPEVTSKLADGSETKNQRFVIRELELGGIKIFNVPGIVSHPAGDLLLGQSLLERLDSWSLDNKRHVLIVGSPGAAMKQSDNKPSPPPPQTGFSPADEESIKRITTKYYDSVQKKDIEGAMNYYATEKRPQIKKSRIEAIAKDTEYYKIESITVISTEVDKAKSLTLLIHKKHDLPPESWEITLEMIKERGDWKIWATPGRKISSKDTSRISAPIYPPTVPKEQGSTSDGDKEYVATFDGVCKELNISGAIMDERCDSQMLQIINKYRAVMFIFGTSGEGMLWFIGWNESLPKPNLYRLKVEKVVYLKGESKTDIPVQGQCTMEGDVHKDALIACNAISLQGEKPFHAVFKMTAPPKIVYGDKLQ